MQRMLALEKALSLGHWAVLGRPINGLWAGFLTQWPNWADPNGPAHGPCTGLPQPHGQRAQPPPQTTILSSVKSSTLLLAVTGEHVTVGTSALSVATNTL
jgi:hypothetical protein